MHTILSIGIEPKYVLRKAALGHPNSGKSSILKLTRAASKNYANSGRSKAVCAHILDR